MTTTDDPCPNCSAQRDGRRFCPTCGTPRNPDDMPRAPGSPVTDVAVVELPLGVAPLRPIQVFWAVFAALWAWSVTTAVVVYVVTRLLVQHALNNL